MPESLAERALWCFSSSDMFTFVRNGCYISRTGLERQIRVSARMEPVQLARLSFEFSAMDTYYRWHVAEHLYDESLF